jgi:hydroxyisourate hydrolase
VPAKPLTLPLPAGGAWNLLGSFVTNDDGRISSGPALKSGDMLPGRYEWLFCVGDYFAVQGAAYAPAGTPFLGEVPIRFGIDDPESHYHVPLLCSPFSFSTYRGS